MKWKKASCIVVACGLSFVTNSKIAIGAESGRISVISVGPGNEARNAAVTRFGITRDDARQIRSAVPNIRFAVPVREVPTTARNADREFATRLIGTTTDFARLDRVRIEHGRFLSPFDEARRDNVVVLGPAVASALFPAEDATGRALRLESDVYRVIGQLGVGSSRDLRDAAIMPVSTMRSRLGDVAMRRQSGAFSARAFELSRLELILSREKLDPTKRIIESLLRKTHEFDDYRVDIVAANQFDLPMLNQPQQPPPILALGELESGSEVVISNPLRGSTVILSLVPEGTTVKKGDLLVELDASALRDRLSKAQIELTGAERKLAAAKSQLAAVQLQLEAEKRTGRLKLETAELAKERYFGQDGEHAVAVARLTREIEVAESAMSLAEKTVTAANQEGDGLALASAQREQIEARASLENAKGELRLLNGPTRKLHAKTHELEIETARASLAQQEATAKARLTTTEDAVAVAGAALDAAREHHADLNNQVESAKLFAPIDGTVVYAAAVAGRRATSNTLSVGATVQQRQPLLRVSNQKKLQVRVRVHEAQVRRIRIGQQCRLAFGALPNQVVKGVVKSVGNIPIRQNFFADGVKKYDVIVTISDPVSRLRLGMTCDARFEE